MGQLQTFAQARAHIGEFVRTQQASVEHFWDAHEQIFFRNEGEREELLALNARPTADLRKAKRLTSTVTCYESLMEGPLHSTTPHAWGSETESQKLREFIERSLEDDDWQSDTAAWVYCRVRTLGASLRLLGQSFPDSELSKDATRRLIDEAWKSRFDDGGAFGLREATKSPRDNPDLEKDTQDKQYPSNAYLTYWGMLAARLAGEVFGTSFTVGPISPEAQHAAADWMESELTTQVSLHYLGSTHADPQQLAWAVCALVRFGHAKALANRISVKHELLKAGLDAFFAQQKADGSWSQGAPLFHYKNAGNAYSYMFEVLGELVSLATSKEVDRSVSAVLNNVLKGYSSELVAALNHAEATGQSMGDSLVGWSSGHHPHRYTPESWATASVYRFAQGLRRLIGTWSSDEAKSALGARQPEGDLSAIRERGATWDLGHGTVGGFLSTAFVHPVRRVVALSERDDRFLPDPDRRLLEENQARSAMLFGPPGTGKTKLVEAVAGAIGWDFIEITPAQFLNDGVDNVSAQADLIFRKVMELDHCVVLLDEIDELIQRRSKDAETLERFFTTTMLPRLAKLWENRRILFFVNTNNILRVDSAIVRSQRFDAALLVLPPGHATKKMLLAKESLTLAVAEDDITNAILDKDSTPAATRGIGWLALVRYDQMGALAASIKESSNQTTVDSSILITGLNRLARELSRLDWNGDEDHPKQVGSGVIVDLPGAAEQFGAERRDSRMRQFAALDQHTRNEDIPGGVEVQTIGSDRWVSLGAPESPEAWAKKNSGVLTSDGVLSFSSPSSES